MEEEIMLNNDELLDFDFKTETAANIKVIGVGGGGGNAVSHMYEEHINSVNFVLANTDLAHLNAKPVPHKLLLGPKLLKGRGTGYKPELGAAAARESEEEIRKLFNDGTEMVFVTAGMGGGTGTGSSPVIAGIAKEMGMLTVGIVTIPYIFEKGNKIMVALDGVEKLSENVDALIVINNEKLLEMYPELSYKQGFKKADDTLLVAAKSIADIITRDDYMNEDLNDVRTTLKDSGVAVISYGEAEGEHRVTRAIESAIHSPLLNNSNVYMAKKILFVIYSSNDNPLTMREMKDDIHPFMKKFSDDIDVIYGIGDDDTLGDKVRATVLASGFNLDIVPQFDEKIQRDKDRMTDAERDRIEREKEAAARAEERKRLLIVRHYGIDKLNEIVGYKTPEPRIFKTEQLDDDDFIEKILGIPTYMSK
jgi:cell division protein FtsZ